MNKYAIIKLGGKQFKVSEGDSFDIERQHALNFDVLAYSDGVTSLIGNPFLTDIVVELKKEGEKKGKKVIIQRFKAKSRYRRKQGHRQPLTSLKVEKIYKKGEEAVKKMPVKKEASTESKVKAIKKEPINRTKAVKNVKSAESVKPIIKTVAKPIKKATSARKALVK